MVFRRPWGAALVWRGGCRGCRTAGVWRRPPLLQWPQAVEWGGGRLCRWAKRHPWAVRPRHLARRHSQARDQRPGRLGQHSATATRWPRRLFRASGCMAIGGHALIVAAARLAMCRFPKARLTRLQRSPLPLYNSPPAARHPALNQPEPTLAAPPAALPASDRHRIHRASASPASAQAPRPEPDAGIAALAACTPARHSTPPARPPAAAPAPTDPPVRPSQPTRSRPTPPAAPISGSEHQNARRPRPPTGPAPRQRLICPCARRVQAASATNCPQNLHAQTNRSSQSACGPS